MKKANRAKASRRVRVNKVERGVVWFDWEGGEKWRVWSDFLNWTLTNGLTIEVSAAA